jgi:methyl-accepting chemotaxis protein
MFMSNWAIARRLTLSFLLAALIAGAAAGLAGLTHAQALGTEAQLYRQILTANQYLGLADNNLLLMDPTLHNAIQDAESNLPDDLAIAKQSLQLMESQLNTALHHYGTEDLFTHQPNARQVLSDAGQADLLVEQAQFFASTQRTWQFYQTAQEQVLADLAAGNVNEAIDYEHRQGEPTHSDALSALNSLLQFNKQMAGAVQSGISQEDQLGTFISVLAALLAFIAVLIVGWLVSRSIIRPINNLHQLTQSVAKGHFNSRAQVLSADEIGSVTEAVNGMLDTIVGLFYKTREQRDMLTSRAEQLEGNLRGAGAGDLRVVAEESTDAVGRLAATFNLTLNRFRRFITHSQATVEQFDTVVRQVGERSSSLTKSTRLEAARFAHLSTVAVSLAEQMRQAQQQITDTIINWQVAIEQLQAGRAVTERVLYEAQNASGLKQEGSTTVVTILAQRTQELGEAARLAEDVARRAARVALTAEVQIEQIRDRVPGLGIVTEELHALSGQATEAAHQMVEAVSEAQAIMQQATDGINKTNQDYAAILSWNTAVVSEINNALQASEIILIKQAQQFNQLRAGIAYAQTAEEISRVARQSGTFLQTIGVETYKVSQAADQLLQLNQRLFASLTPFKLPAPSGTLVQNEKSAPTNERVKSLL